jgi:hypothetical protein
VAERGDICGDRQAADMRRVLQGIGRDAAEVQSPSIPTGLYRRAGYLITRSYSRSWAPRSIPSCNCLARSPRGRSGALQELVLRQPERLPPW